MRIRNITPLTSTTRENVLHLYIRVTRISLSPLSIQDNISTLFSSHRTAIDRDFISLFSIFSSFLSNMKALNSLIAAIFLLLGGAWVAEASAQPGPGSPKYDPSKNPSIHNCPGYGLTRRAHGGVCPPPPGKPNGMAVGGMPGANAGQPISLSQPSPGTAGAVNSGSGPQGKPKSLVPGPPFKGAQPAKQPARRSVSDLFFDEDTGSSFLRRAESSNEPLLSQRSKYSLHEAAIGVAPLEQD